jgi:hypothetical protein
MARLSNQSVTQLVRDFTADYCLGQSGIDVLDRLGADHKALEAIGVITGDTRPLPYGDGDESSAAVQRLLELCLEAFWMLREYRGAVTRKRDLDATLSRHREYIEELRRFVDAAADERNLRPPLLGWDPIPATDQDRLDRLLAYPPAATAGLQDQRDNALVPGSAEYFRDALDRLYALTELQQRAGLRDLVVTRQAHSVAAAEKAVIGSFAASVKREFGRPHTAQVATLAGVALNISVSETRVRDALKAHARKLG